MQLVTERISGNKGGSYDSTEINLVFHDGTRRHMIDHGGKSIAEDARRLAEFLEVPLWSQRAAHRPLDPTRDPSFSQLWNERISAKRSSRDP